MAMAVKRGLLANVPATTWNAIIWAKIPDPTKVPRTDLRQFLTDHLLASVEIKMKPHSRVIGNKAGLSFLARFNRQDKSIRQLREGKKAQDKINRQLQEDHRQLQEDKKAQDNINLQLEENISSLRKDMMLIRAIDLESFSERPDPADKDERNELVHGANVILDLETLAFLKANDEQRWQRATKGFEKADGLSASIYERKIKDAPQQVPRAINMRRNLNHLRVWGRKLSLSPNVREDMITECESIVRAWQESISSGTHYAEDERKPVNDDLISLHKSNIQGKK